MKYHPASPTSQTLEDLARHDDETNINYIVFPFKLKIVAEIGKGGKGISLPWLWKTFRERKKKKKVSLGMPGLHTPFHLRCC